MKLLLKQMLQSMFYNSIENTQAHFIISGCFLYESFYGIY